MKKTITLLFTISLCNLSFAQVDCEPYKVETIQLSTTDILVRFESNNGSLFWKKIGHYSNPATKPYLALLMQAFTMNNNIVIRYLSDPYTWDSTDFYNIPMMVNLSKG